MPTPYHEISTVFKAFCDDHRLHIIDLLVNGEFCACEILERIQISQSTLSHHMKILVEAQIVHARKSGKWTYYALNSSGLEEAKTLLNQLFTPTSAMNPSCSCEETNEKI